ncbi:hypothetical protein [Oricola thermophila]|nr:hypothetical protein [Oricola thermophila]
MSGLAFFIIWWGTIFLAFPGWLGEWLAKVDYYRKRWKPEKAK